MYIEKTELRYMYMYEKSVVRCIRMRNNCDAAWTTLATTWWHDLSCLEDGRRMIHPYIPHICHFWYATIYFRPVKGTPKKCVNSRQKMPCLQRKSIFWNTNSHIASYINFWHICFFWRTLLIEIAYFVFCLAYLVFWLAYFLFCLVFSVFLFSE